MSRLDVDVLIIGGASSAAARRCPGPGGQRVALLERNFLRRPGQWRQLRRGTPPGPPLVQLPCPAAPIRSGASARTCWVPMANTSDPATLKLARSDTDFASLQPRPGPAQASLGLDLQLLDRGELRRRFPWVGDIAVGASFCPEDGHANPRRSPGLPPRPLPAPAPHPRTDRRDRGSSTTASASSSAPTAARP